MPKEFEMDYQPLDKPIHEMTPAELAQRDAEATERQKNKMVITPKEQRQHWPSYEEQTAIWLKPRFQGSPIVREI